MNVNRDGGEGGTQQKKYRFMHIKLHAQTYNTHSYSHPMGGLARALLKIFIRISFLFAA